MNLLSKIFKVQMAIFPSTIKSNQYLCYLRNLGMKIGKGTIVYSPGTVTIDTSRPHLLEIGDYCKITGGVIILAHDYSRSVIRMKYGDLIAEAQKTKIGNNVFIGMNSIILMGSNIGDNVVIGAGSVVTGNVPCDSVVAGNPAKVIMSLEHFYTKRKNRQVTDASCYYLEFKKHYGREPSIEDMNSFFPLYLERDMDMLKKNNLRTSLGGDDEESLLDWFANSQPYFNGYDEFKNYCEKLEERK